MNATLHSMYQRGWMRIDAFSLQKQWYNVLHCILLCVISFFVTTCLFFDEEIFFMASKQLHTFTKDFYLYFRFITIYFNKNYFYLKLLTIFCPVRRILLA